jgi:ATP-dependent exoDNAse (exonuclease V) beta subunit
VAAQSRKSALALEMAFAELAPAHPRDAALAFDAASHTYTVGGATFTSVTTYLKPLFPPFDADRVIEKMVQSKKWPQSPYFGQTPAEIKEKWRLAGEEAAAQGTKLHADIENYYKGQAFSNDSPEFAYFLEFAAKVGLKPYRSEWTVYDEALQIAGTIDMVFEGEDGALHIYDWKRVKNIELGNPFRVFATHPKVAHLPDTNYAHYALQLNLYKLIVERNYGKRVSALKLVALHPTLPSYKTYDVGDLSAELADLFDLHL